MHVITPTTDSPSGTTNTVVSDLFLKARAFHGILDMLLQNSRRDTAVTLDAIHRNLNQQGSDTGVLMIYGTKTVKKLPHIHVHTDGLLFYNKRNFETIDTPYGFHWSKWMHLDLILEYASKHRMIVRELL